MTTLIRLAGHDLMAQVLAPLGLLEQHLLDIAAVSQDPGDLFTQLVARGFRVCPVLGITGSEDALVRLDRDQALIRIPGDDYRGTWASAPVERILGRGAYDRRSQDSLHALRRLKSEVRCLMQAGDLQDAVLAVIGAAEGARRAQKA